MTPYIKLFFFLILAANIGLALGMEYTENERIKRNCMWWGVVINVASASVICCVDTIIKYTAR